MHSYIWFYKMLFGTTRIVFDLNSYCENERTNILRRMQHFPGQHISLQANDVC